jgi:hypothetical protein
VLELDWLFVIGNELGSHTDDSAGHAIKCKHYSEWWRDPELLQEIHVVGDASTDSCLQGVAPNDDLAALPAVKARLSPPSGVGLCGSVMACLRRR